MRKIGEFRPFGAHNDLGSSAIGTVVDAARRRWYFVATRFPPTGTEIAVWSFDLDTMAQEGAPLALSGSFFGAPTMALEPNSGSLLVDYKSPSSETRIAVVRPTAAGPSLARDWPYGAAIAPDTPGLNYDVAGLSVSGGKVWAGAQGKSGVLLVRLDAARLVSGGDPFDWRYQVPDCSRFSYANAQAAIGKSAASPRVTLACPGASSSNLQGVSVVDLGSDGASPSTFQETYYPIAGNFGTSESAFDPTTDRITMRRTGPAQLVTFDVAHRRWMRPVVFGQDNMYVLALDSTTGRYYGEGNDLTGHEFIYVPEVRPTPPQNGLVMPFETPSPASTMAAIGTVAVDPPTHRIFFADIGTHTEPGPTGGTVDVSDGIFFHVYQDTRPPEEQRVAANADNAVVNPSGESQGYGARVDYVGGVAGTFQNQFSSQYGGGQVVAGGTRQATFARTLSLRMSDGESSAKAIGVHPEGAMAAEVGTTQQPWPYPSVGCVDFGGPGATHDGSSQGATVHCDFAGRGTQTNVVYDAGSGNTYANPIQHASTTSDSHFDPKRGVVTTVHSEGSLDIPGIVHIGKVTATAETWAAGAPGKAGSTYSRTMSDVSIAGTPVCSSTCDPQAVADQINSSFAGLKSAGYKVEATVPDPDPELRTSPGGAQAIVQQDFWAHEENVAINDGAEDRYESPAFIIAIYQDRAYPQHELYSLAGVQAVSRLPQALAGQLAELAAPPPSVGLPDVGVATALPDLGSQPNSITRHRSGKLKNGRNLVQGLAWAAVLPIRYPGVLAVLLFLALPIYEASRRALLVRRLAEGAQSP